MFNIHWATQISQVAVNSQLYLEISQDRYNHEAKCEPIHTLNTPPFIMAIMQDSFAISLSLHAEACNPFINLDNSLGRPSRQDRKANVTCWMAMNQALNFFGLPGSFNENERLDLWVKTVAEGNKEIANLNDTVTPLSVYFIFMENIISF